MTKKELKEVRINTIQNLVESYIKNDLKKLNTKNKKLYKDILSKDLQTVIFCLSIIKNEYYSWEIYDKDDNANSNFDRLIYLFNRNFSENMLTYGHNSVIIENDESITIKNNTTILDYNSLAEEVGL